MPWRAQLRGRDLVSTRMVKDDYYTSIHIEEFEIEARDHEAPAGGDHARHPNVSETFLRGSRRERHHSASGASLGQAGRHPRSAR